MILSLIGVIFGSDWLLTRSGASTMQQMIEHVLRSSADSDVSDDRQG